MNALRERLHAVDTPSFIIGLRAPLIWEGGRSPDAPQELGDGVRIPDDLEELHATATDGMMSVARGDGSPAEAIGASRGQ